MKPVCMCDICSYGSNKEESFYIHYILCWAQYSRGDTRLYLLSGGASLARATYHPGARRGRGWGSSTMEIKLERSTASSFFWGEYFQFGYGNDSDS